MKVIFKHIHTMKTKHYLLSLIAVVLFASCGTTRTVPLTGRKQNLMVSDAEVLSLSNQQYAEYMKTAKASTNATNTAMVKRVGQKLATAVETYLRNNGMTEDVQNYSWVFNLVQDNQVNAFCMPGGKIVVYEGLLPVTQNEASLAIVLGHEIAHAVARHSAEQMSKKIKQQYGTQIGGAVLGALGMGSNTTSILQAIAQQGFQFKNLSYSRDHEYEADHMGLIFAAMAGYDPQVAVTFWQRMAASSQNQTSEFMSDHPSDANRIKKIQAWMPEALRYYKPATTTTTAKKTPTTRTAAKTATTTKR